jgi:hypothetical protein
MMKNCQRVSAGTKWQKLERVCVTGVADGLPRNIYWFTMEWLLYFPTASPTDLSFNLLSFNERRILVYYQINLGSNFLTDLCKTISK